MKLEDYEIGKNMYFNKYNKDMEVIKYFLHMYTNEDMINSYYYQEERKETPTKKTETTKAKVIRLLKGDFEKKLGISFETFIETYNKILEESPEDLI